jgi:uncharacterized membrane protein YgcG
MRRAKRSTAAGIVGLAVSGHVQILEEAGKPLSARRARSAGSAEYRLRFLGAAGLDAPNVAFAHVFFGDDLSRPYDRSQEIRDRALGAEIVEFMSEAETRTEDDGLRRRGVLWPGLLLLALAAALTVVSCILGPSASADGVDGLMYLFLVPLALVVGIWLDGAVRRAPLTAAGAELRDHIKGLELYIKLAEKDRMRILQSPEGALRTRVAAGSVAGGPDPMVVVELYERLLPYAVMLGLERQWSAVLGAVYDDLSRQPGWYTGTGSFHAGAFVAGISSFAAATTTSYSGSGSGGAGGGGSSGGGGGGGGGGGV